MSLLSYFNFLSLFCMIVASCNKEISIATNTTPPPVIQRTAYYFSNEGNDAGEGSQQYPMKSIAALNALHLNNGDSVFFKGGETFSGNIQLVINPSSSKIFTLGSYGNDTAIIDAGNGTAVEVNQSSNLAISNIICKGSGRKNGNASAGVVFNHCNGVNISNIGISGFQKAGLLIFSCARTNIAHVYAHDNGFAGISVSGETKKDDCSDIHIAYSRAENNPGDPTNLTNHSGNGIIAGFCRNVLIEYCTATNNGWDMPRIGNGPVGIWCYEADSVVIQHCISYRNKTSNGGEDGGGYDLDGGTTNSVIQYCLSYENYGSAFGIFQYAGASNWHNNVIRYCISENDGKVSAAHAGAYVWNSSHDSTQFQNFLFYNNTIYNDSGTAVNYSVESDHSNFKFYNNIFVAGDELLKGKYTSDVFLGNDWWSLKSGFAINGEHDFQNWCFTYNKERLNGHVTGLNVNVPFVAAGQSALTEAGQLSSYNNYQVNGNSPVMQSGIDLQALFSINTGSIDFNSKPVDTTFIGACASK